MMQAFRLTALFKRDPTQGFPVNISEFLETPFSTEYLLWLLLSVVLGSLPSKHFAVQCPQWTIEQS